MWIFSVTPDWLYHTLFFASLIAILTSIFLARTPLTKHYSTVLKWAGLVSLVITIFLEGALYSYNVMQERIAEIKKQVEVAEQATKETNTNLAKKQQTFAAKNTVKREYIYQYIDREVTKYDTQCVIPESFIKAHNDAAEKAK